MKIKCYCWVCNKKIKISQNANKLPIYCKECENKMKRLNPLNDKSEKILPIIEENSFNHILGERQ